MVQVAIHQKFCFGGKNMNLAKNFINETVLKPVKRSDVCSWFPGAEVSINSPYSVKMVGDVVRFTCPTEKLGINLGFPEKMLPGFTMEQSWTPFTKELMMLRPYDSDFSDRVGSYVLHEKHGVFGIVPGSVHYNDEHELCIDIEYNPFLADAILVYSTSPMVMSYASTHRRLGFELGDTGIYGVVLPFNYLVDLTNAFSGCSEAKLRYIMAEKLAIFLERFGALKKAVS